MNQRWIRIALVAIAACIAAFFIWRIRDHYADDAYITLRYVARFLAGQGLTWTDGERVEGYTNPLWLAQIAVLGGIRMPLVPATIILGVAYVGALLALFCRSALWPFSVLLVATQPGLVFWSVGGLETTSFAFWLAFGAILLLRAIESTDRFAERHATLAGLCFAAATLTRPEGTGCAVIACLWLILARRDQPKLAQRLALTTFAPFIVFLAFRFAYYGDFLSNSSWAKTAGIPLEWRIRAAWDYLLLYDRHWLPAAVVAIGISAISDKRHAVLGVIALTLPLFGGLFAGGGDHMPEGRMIVPIAVLLAIATSAGGDAIQARIKPFVAAFIGLMAIVQARATWEQHGELDAAAAVGRPVGHYLESTLEPGTLVATATAGATPFFAPSIRFLDTLGLNDRVIARRAPPFVTRMQAYTGHQKGNGAYVLTRAPDVILLGPAEGYLGADPKRWFLGDWELLHSPEFHANYAPYQFWAPIAPDEAKHWRVQLILNEDHSSIRIVAWLRKDSEKAQAMADHGIALISPR